MTPLSTGTLWLSVNLTPGVLSQSGAKVSYQYSTIVGKVEIPHACRMWEEAWKGF